MIEVRASLVQWIQSMAEDSVFSDDPSWVSKKSDGIHLLCFVFKEWSILKSFRYK